MTREPMRIRVCTFERRTCLNLPPLLSPWTEQNPSQDLYFAAETPPSHRLPMMATTTRRLVLFATKLSLLISAFSLRQVRSWVPRPFTGANHSRLLQSKDTSNNDSSTSSDDANKFSFQQRIDSGKSLAVGAVSSSLAVAPMLWIHDARDVGPMGI